MRLQEIFNTDQTTPWVKSLETLVAKHGLKLFNGQNAYVIVSEDRNYVYRFWVRDPGYEEWVKVALENQDNPHFPKILGKIRIIPARFAKLPSDMRVKMLKIEKLSPATGRWADIGSLIGHVVLKNHDMATWNTEYLTVKIVEMAQEVSDSSEEAAEIKELLDKNEKFVQAAVDIINIGYSDFTEDNIMMRGSIPVITDPVSS